MFPVQALARMAVHNERWSLALMRYAQKRTSLVCVASNNFAARRYINTTNKNKDHSTVDVYDPEYVGVKKPKGPETPKEFADVGKQKVGGDLIRLVFRFVSNISFSSLELDLVWIRLRRLQDRPSADTFGLFLLHHNGPGCVDVVCVLLSRSTVSLRQQDIILHTILITNLFPFVSYSKAEWALREAFLELDRRERLGLPLIDPNYVDPAKIELPSEEELVGVEILY